MAEHMLILCVENPEGEKTYVAAAFPSACGKTNFAMLIPPKAFEGWKVWTIGDDIAWIKPERTATYAPSIRRPASSASRRAPRQDQPQRDGDARANTIFTNVALTADGGVWWEGMTDEPPAECLDWQGKHWTPEIGKETGTTASRTERRFTAPPAVPYHRAGMRDPHRRAHQRHPSSGPPRHTLPLVYQSFNWSQGVYSAPRGSETTAAAAGAVGKVRRDPMAMLPFCGYHMGDYLRHRLTMQRSLDVTPRIFNVNWFRKDADGNSSGPDSAKTCASSWIVDRVHGRATGETRSAGSALRRHQLDGPRLFPRLLRRAYDCRSCSLAQRSHRARGVVHRTHVIVYPQSLMSANCSFANSDQSGS